MKIKIPNGFIRQPHAENNKIHQVFLYGTIGWDINVQQLWNDLQSLPSNVEELDFYVHSEGGLVYEGYALLTNLQRLKQQYHTRMHIDGIAASMMSAIAVEAHETIASPTSKMIIHDPWMGLDIYGGYNSARIEDLIKELESIKSDLDSDGEIMAGVYARKTGLGVEEVRSKWMADGKDHHFTPAEMVDLGLADKIATADFPKPPKMEEQDDEAWLADLLAGGRKAAKTGGISDAHYRGAHEKLFARFAFNSQKRDNYAGSPNVNSDKKPEKNMKFAAIAKKYGLDPNVDESTILSHIERREAHIAKVEQDLEKAQGLIDEFKQTKETQAAKITKLENENRETKAGTVVDEIIADVMKNVQGKRVNKNIRGQMKELAVDALAAEANDDERSANNAREHMKLLAQNNLVPVGADPNLADPKGEGRTDEPGTLTEDRLKAAQEEGKRRAQKKTPATAI